MIILYRIIIPLYERLLLFRVYLRVKFLRSFFKHIGKDVWIMDNIHFWSRKTIYIGNHVFINSGCNIGQGNIYIGNHVKIAFNVTIIAQNHRYDDWRRPIAKQGYIESPIVIEDDVWIGANATILSGVRIGRGSIVAAGSVVTNNVFPFSIVGGVPAKLIKDRFSKSIKTKAKNVVFDDYSIW